MIEIEPLMSFSVKMSNLPESVQNFVKTIAQSSLAEKIILFGSRARGDHNQNSDYDLAVFWQPHHEGKVLKFKADLSELPLTLHKVDILDLSSASDSYRREIKNEGILLWQKKA